MEDIFDKLNKEPIESDGAFFIPSKEWFEEGLENLINRWVSLDDPEEGYDLHRDDE